MNTPSVKTIADALHIDTAHARAIKNLITGETRAPNDPDTVCHQSHKIAAIMDECARIGRFYGVEYQAAKADRDDCINGHGISYLNAGDVYAGTLIYDHENGRYYATSVGDYIERPSVAARFNDE